jgi:hypothetical protein
LYPSELDEVDEDEVPPVLSCDPEELAAVESEEDVGT